MNFQVNDIVRVVDRQLGHGFKLGEVTYIIDVTVDYTLAKSKNYTSGFYVCEAEIVKIGRIIKFKK